MSVATLDRVTFEGHVSPGFEAVREAFADNFARRGELGGACCAYHRGEKVVDLWGGIRNKDTGEPWERDTMVVVWSASKGLAAMTLAWGIGDRAGTVPVALFMIVDGLAGLPAFRVLMVWVYDRTESLFVARVMHASLTACTLILTSQTTGVFVLTYGLAFAAAVWAVLAAIAIANSGHLSRQRLQRRTWA